MAPRSQEELQEELMLKSIRRIPLFKYMFSYVFPQALLKRTSLKSGELTVRLVNGRLQLVTDSAVYSYGDLYDIFIYGFQQCDFKSKAPDEVLLLGYGLGSIPQIFAEKYRVRPYFTAVELDPVIIELAKQFNPIPEEHMKYVEANALEFIHTHRHRYDLICVDIFIHEEVPLAVDEEEHALKMYDLLKPGGVVLFNRIVRNNNQKARASLYFDEVFEGCFDSAEYIERGENVLLIGRRN